MTYAFLKYPRTSHLVGSGRQTGDADLPAVPFSTIRGRRIVVEEKADGAQSGMRIAPDGTLRLQSRGDELRGGASESQFSRFKDWAARIEGALRARLGERYLLFGEWMAVRHSLFYDALPHLWLQYDAADLEAGARRGRPVFLSTRAQRALLAGLPIRRVPALYEGPALSLEHLRSPIVRRAPGRAADPALRPAAHVFGIRDEAVLADVGPSSRLRTAAWRTSLAEAARRGGEDPADVLAAADRSDWMEGVYVKVEEGDETVGRLTLVRPDFVQTILDDGRNRASRRFVYNRLAPDADLDAPAAELPS